jgi:hypothetical protein
MPTVLAIIAGTITVAAAFCTIYMIGWFVAKYILKIGCGIDAEIALGTGFISVFAGTLVIGILYAFGSGILEAIGK